MFTLLLSHARQRYLMTVVDTYNILLKCILRQLSLLMPPTALSGDLK